MQGNCLARERDREHGLGREEQQGHLAQGRHETRGGSRRGLTEPRPMVARPQGCECQAASIIGRSWRGGPGGRSLACSGTRLGGAGPHAGRGLRPRFVSGPRICWSEPEWGLNVLDSYGLVTESNAPLGSALLAGGLRLRRFSISNSDGYRSVKMVSIDLSTAPREPRFC